MKVKITISLDKELITRLENLKGTINVSAYINDVLTQWVDMKEGEELEVKPKINNLKDSIKNIIKKNDSKGGINIEELFITLKDSFFDLDFNRKEFEEKVNQLLINGEIYEPRPKVLRWLE